MMGVLVPFVGSWFPGYICSASLGICLGYCKIVLFLYSFILEKNRSLTVCNSIFWEESMCSAGSFLLLFEFKSRAHHLILYFFQKKKHSVFFFFGFYVSITSINHMIMYKSNVGWC